MNVKDQILQSVLDKAIDNRKVFSFESNMLSWPNMNFGKTGFLFPVLFREIRGDFFSDIIL